MSDENWIAEATAKNKGAFRRQAARRGMTTSQFIEYVLRPDSKFDARTRRRANLAKTLIRINKKKRKG